MASQAKKNASSSTRSAAAIATFLLITILCSAPEAFAQQSLADSLYNAAAIHHNNGEADQALALYSRVIALDSTYTDAYWNRGRLRADPTDAIDDFRHVTELASDFGPGWGHYGWSLLLRKDLQGAKAASREATLLDPTEFAWWANLGHTFLLEGAADSAYFFYTSALQRMQANDQLRATLADIEHFSGGGSNDVNLHEAVQWLEEQFLDWRVPQLRSDSLWRVGDSLRKAEQYRAAADAFERAAATEESATRVRRPDVWNSLWSAARAYRAAGEGDDAARTFEKALEAVESESASADHARILAEYVRSLDAIEEDSLLLATYEQAIHEAESLGLSASITTAASSAGNALSRAFRFDEALLLHERSLGIDRESGDSVNVEVDLSNAAWALLQLGRLPEALAYYEESLSIAQQLHRSSEARRIRDVAAVHGRLGNSDKALALYETALSKAKTTGSDQENEMVISGNIGSILIDWGRYDEAVDWYEKAMELAGGLDDQWSVAIYLNNIGDVMDRWGRTDESLSYRQRALEIASANDDAVSSATFLNNIGLLYQQTGDYESALEYLEQSLAINRRLKMSAETASSLLNLGGMYEDLGQTSRAFELYEEAYAIASSAGARATAASAGNALGLWYSLRRDYDNALAQFNHALAIQESTGNMEGQASILHNRGAVYARTDRSEAAIRDWSNAIEMLEEIRRTATYQIRRDYLQKQLGTYQLLLIHMNEAGDARGALAAMGTMQGRSLGDQLAQTDTLQHGVDLGSLESHQIVLNYGLVADGFLPIVVSADVANAAMNQVQLDVLQSVTQDSTDDKTTSLSRVISEFRLITGRSEGTRGAAAAAGVRRQTEARRREIGRALYDALITPIESSLTGKSELIIVPDGVLAFIPFESLVLPDGSYLGEHFEVKYEQSLAIRDIAMNRTYSGDRKPLIAFGGAVYESGSDPVVAEPGADDKSGPDAASAASTTSAYAALDRGGDQTGSYESLGYASWSNLPGTLEEVGAIADIVDGSIIVTGADVSESTVKNLSESGELSSYRVIHFATHGMAVPEVPELSALVLSQHSSREDDGYLRMEEIARLKIQADFVNLSACETGLGKLYGGEGVVGLTQSFLLAGANGLSVSLWQVADVSTSLFMEQLYALVESDGVSYSTAMATVKRMFISGEFGDDYRDPYYWAPFVYYGL